MPKEDELGRAMRPAEYAYFYKRLLYFYPPESAHMWMRSEHKLLNGRRPVDCNWCEIDQLIKQLEEAVYI